MTIRKPVLFVYDRFTKTDFSKIFILKENTITLAENSNSSFDYLLDKLSHISCSQWFILILLNSIAFSFILTAYFCTQH